MPQRYMCPNFNWEYRMVAALQRRKLNMFQWRACFHRERWLGETPLGPSSRPDGAPFVSEVRESGPWRTSVTGGRDGLLKQTARILHADCFRSLSERAVGAGRGRLAVTGCWGELLKQTARIPYAECFRSPSERAVRAGRGRTSVTSRWDGLLKQTARIPFADCFRSQSERAAVDGWPWRAAGMDFWNKRHGFLSPIVSKVSQSGPWGRAVDGLPWRAARMLWLFIYLYHFRPYHLVSNLPDIIPSPRYMNLILS